MTDEEKLESGQTSVDEELPAPTFTEQKGDSSISADADEIVNKVREALQDDIKKAIQSTKDKRFSALERAGTDLLARLEAAGVSVPENVVTQMRIEELERQLQVKPSKEDTGGTASTKEAVADAVAEMAKAGLDTNNPEFIKLLRGNYRNRDAFDAAVFRHISSRLVPQPPASPSGATPSPATGGVRPQSPEALTQEYIDKILAARGNKALITQLREQYRNKGVQVDNVSFSV